MENNKIELIDVKKVINRVKEYKKENKLTNEEMADLFDFADVRQYNKLMAGQVKHLDRFIDFADNTGLDIKSLLCEGFAC